MKVQFAKQSTQTIITGIRQAMDGRALGDMVSIDEERGGLLVKISRLGTSSLQFDRSENGEFAVFTLSEEKIAFAHRAFKDEVKSKLVHIIEKSGGKILEV
jgi:hypothetical protein